MEEEEEEKNRSAIHGRKRREHEEESIRFGGKLIFCVYMQYSEPRLILIYII